MEGENDKQVRRKDARAGEIMEAAMKVFERRGFGQATMAEIAREAGAAKGTLYLYYKSKEDIFRRMVLDLIVPLREGMSSQMSAPGNSAWEAIKFIVTTPYREMVDNPMRRAVFRILIAEGDRFPELAAFHYKHSIAQVLVILEELIGRGKANGEFRPDLTSDHIRPMIAPVVMASIWKMTFEKVSPLDLESFAAAHLDLLERAIRA